MKKVIKAIKEIQKNRPTIYVGRGEFREFTIELNPSLDIEKIKTIASKNNFILPKDYMEFLSFSNGIYFYESFDHQFYPLEEAIAYTKEDNRIEKGYLNIATCLEDDIYMKCDGSYLNMYISEEGISDLRPLNMTFEAFMECGLISGFAYFWLWGQSEDGLY